jgi:hypothetical protein
MPRPLTLLALSLTMASSQESAKLPSVPVIPPPPAMEPVSNPDAAPAFRSRTNLWSIGNPTDSEQLYLELINRARANPTAEGVRLAALTDPDVVASYNYFSVNLATMQSEMAALVVAPPLAMNEKLLQSARSHSNDQYTNQFQGHSGSDGSNITTRFNRVGYSASYAAENVYATSKSPAFGHAGFEVDWGSGPGGMQTGRGHRAIIHAGFREVGIGIRAGTNGSVGPEVVTQDFGVPAGAAFPFVTGVAYYDFDGDNFYDPGEGIGGVTVNVQGASYHAVTSASGGYAVPVPAGAAQRTVTFSGNGFNSTQTVSINSVNNNVKADFKPAYTPPTVSGVTLVTPGAPEPYQLSPTGGASSYEWRAMKRTPAAFDGANSLTRVLTSTYAFLSTQTKQEGSSSYQLTQPQGNTATVTYRNAFRAGAAPALQFQSRLAAATGTQRAQVQVSADNGATWSVLDSQNGTGATGQTSFSLRTVPLTSVAGRDFLLRFAYVFAGGTYYPGTGSGYGWFVDAVTFNDVLDTSEATVSGTGGSRDFSFAPPDTGTWLLSGRATVSGRSLEFGPLLEVIATPSPSYSSWAAPYESGVGLPAGTLSGAPAADYNKDGIANLMAYALNLSPVSNSTLMLPRAVVSQGLLQLDYPRYTDRTDITVTPQISADLLNWYAPGQAGAPAGFIDSILSTAGAVQTRRASVPVQGAQRWLRLKVTRP